MTIRLMAAIAVTSAGTAAVLAGSFDAPWAVVETADKSDVRKEFPVAITQVDGKSTRDPRQTDPIAPGKHTITVRFSTARVAQSASDEVREVPMDLQPCTLYRIAARRTTGTNWEPQVYNEPLGECRKKFQKN
ncbi:MAG TPA: hypothetical protein VKR38_06820 [Usitatibacter sp.]|nr:hypothetical protein [Usitatibacter sp.]